MTWVNLDSAFGFGTILTSTQQQNLRDNITALANQDQNAPLIIGNRWAKAGLTLSNDTDADHDIAIAVGECIDSQNAEGIKLASILTKQIDVDWAAGDDDGGFPSGLSIAADTWYHVFLIKDRDTGIVDAGFDTSITPTNLLSDASAYDVYRRIGSVLTDGSSNILPFIQINDVFRFLTPMLSIYDIAVAGALNYGTKALDVPPDVNVEAFGNYYAYHNSDYLSYQVQIRPPSCTDGTPSTTASPLGLGLITTNQGNWQCLVEDGDVEVYASNSGNNGYCMKLTVEGWKEFF